MCIPTTSIEKTDAAKITSASATKAADTYSNLSSEVYSWTEPSAEEKLTIKDHFSSLLFGGSVVNTILEHFLLLIPFLPMVICGTDSPLLNQKGSMPLIELSFFFVVCSLVRRFYNTYLEAVYFSFPKLRTQPIKEHRLKEKKDLMGRDQEQLELLNSHDQWTMVSQFILNFALYYALPGFYPCQATDTETEPQSLQERFGRLILNHYIMSFGMYWAHRSLHVIPYLWDNIHSIHHWAKHPLSRNTYEDHWFDNFFNSIIGNVFAQILMPLDYPTFIFSRIFRILESLEKHSGVSCGFNIAYSMQQWMPYASMPHHHDWHHEGFKGSNYTFSSLGGLWDCVFGTRKGGRYKANHYRAATREDLNSKGKKCKELPGWFHPCAPLVGISIAVGMKLNGSF
jgi:sterol desaturase/sphingolipid hydroxylase (fatty acid hydroxylase superfamily)